MSLGTGYFFIRRDTDRCFPFEYEFLRSDGHFYDAPDPGYRTVHEAVAAWQRVSGEVKAAKPDSYIVGPRGGLYDLDGKGI